MKKLILFVTILHFTAQLFAQTDFKGSKDHPVVGRFNGSWILFYEYNKYSQYKLRTEAIKKGGRSNIKKSIAGRSSYPNYISMPQNYRSI